MSKRVTLTTREIEAIVHGLTELKHKSLIDYPVVLAGRRFYDDIIDKLNAPKPQSKSNNKEDV